MFSRYGALFWPDFPVRKNDSELLVWDIMGRKGEYWRELEFESGQVVLDKSRVWRALMLARYMSQQAKFYFTQFLGDKEAFFWGFAGTRTPYFLNPTYIHSVGALVDEAHPTGSPSLDPLQPDTQFCGQSMLQSDFLDDPDAPAATAAAFVPRPMFMHWNMLKYKYTEDVDYFQSAMTYEPPPVAANASIADFRAVGFRVNGQWGVFDHCLDLRHVQGLRIRVWPWGEEYPNKADAFHRAYRIGHDAVEAARVARFRARLADSNDSYAASQPHVPPGSRGVVLVSPRLPSVRGLVLAANILRGAGCKLPISFLYNDGEVDEFDLQILAAHNISALDYRALIKGRTWSRADWWRGAPVAAALLAAPYESVVLMDADTLALADPTALLMSREFLQFGALLWSAATPRRTDPHLARVLGVEDGTGGVDGGTDSRRSWEAMPGLMVFSKSRAWKALRFAEFILSDSSYFFNHMNGYQEAFYWAFLASGTSFYMHPTPPTLLGVPIGSESMQPGALSDFCGQALALPPLPSMVADTAAAAAPLALQPTFLRDEYDPDAAHFRATSALVASGDGVIKPPPQPRLLLSTNESLGRLSHCVAWVESPDVRSHTTDDPANLAHINGLFREAHRHLPRQDEVQGLKKKKLLDALAPYRPHSTTPGARSFWSWLGGGRGRGGEAGRAAQQVVLAPPLGVPSPWFSRSQGIVMLVEEANLPNAIRSLLMLRAVGCKLPVSM
ncbi:hypothetical protein HK405_009644, partial [Cladochytrium tenue]